MITDIVQGLKHKSKSSMFKAQSSKDKKFKTQSSKDKKFKVQERFARLGKFVVGV